MSALCGTNECYCNVFFMVVSWIPVRTPGMDLLTITSTVRQSEREVHSETSWNPSLFREGVAARHPELVFEIRPSYVFSVEN